MRILGSDERRTLRAQAHHLRPCASIGRQGLSAAALKEIDVALRAHELVKVRAFSDDRDEREAWLVRICAELDAAPVQHLGKLLVVWRPRPQPPVISAVAPAKARRHAKDRRRSNPPPPSDPRRPTDPRRPADPRQPTDSRRRADPRRPTDERRATNERHPPNARRRRRP